MKPRPASRGRAALKVAVAAAVALLAAELLCRSAFKKNIEELKFTRSDLYYYHDREGYRHNLPNSVGYERMWDGQGKAEFRINSFGFRGPEPAARKPAGAYRLFFLGDSITLGGRLPEETTFVARVGQALAAESPGRYEAINGGVGDVGLLEEERTLRGEGLRVQPDAVVLCWYLNDGRPPIGFREEVVFDNRLIRWFNGYPSLRKSYLAGFVYDSVRRSLVARNLAQDHRFDWIQPYMAGRWTSDEREFAGLVDLARFDWGDAWNDASLRRMAEKIRALRDLARARGIRFALVALPLHAQVYARHSSPLVDKPQRELAALLAKDGIAALDLLPLLRARSREPLFYDNCHYTPRGNEIVARLILDFLRASGALKQNTP